jgi:hypothetical protein
MQEVNAQTSSGVQLPSTSKHANKQQKYGPQQLAQRAAVSAVATASQDMLPNKAPSHQHTAADSAAASTTASHSAGAGTTLHVMVLLKNSTTTSSN